MKNSLLFKSACAFIFVACASQLYAAAPALNPGTWFHAAQTGNIQTIKDYIANGFSVNSKDSTIGQTALMLAARGGFLNIVTVLIDNGAEVNAQLSTSGASALDFAIFNNHPNIVEDLLGRGARFTSVTPTVLRNASQTVKDAVRLILGSMNK